MEIFGTIILSFMVGWTACELYRERTDGRNR